MLRRMARGNRQRGQRGLGSTWETANGRFGAAIPVARRDPLTGHVTKKRESTTFRTKREADSWRMDLYGQMAAGGGVIDGRVTGQTLREHLEVWLRDSVEPHRSYNTLQKRVWAVSNHIVPALGKIPLSDVSPRSVQSLYASLSREGYKVSTRREVHVTLRQALGQAVRWGLLDRNPASPELVDAPKQLPRDEENEEVRALTDAQAQELFESARNSRWLNYYIVAIRTGLRPGEALGLKWGDVDLTQDPASLRVRRTLDTHGKPRFGPPKSPASRRTLALHFEATQALEAQKAMLQDERLETGADDLVFPSSLGTPMNSGNLRKRNLQNDLEAAGLPILTLHEMRHTYASIALHDWMLPPKIVQEALGHETLKMTMDLYGHLLPNQQRDTMRRINELYSKGKRAETRRVSSL